MRHELRKQTPLRLELFGGFRLFRDGVELALGSQRARSLLAALALRQRWVARADLMAQLWPDTPEAESRRRLSQTLWRLKSALPELELQANSAAVRILTAANLEVDAWQFEAGLLGAGRAEERLSDLQLESHRAALQVYRGDLLSGCTEEWLLEERQRWRLLFVTALGRVTLALEDRDHPALALEVARQWVAADPFDEAAHRAVMRSLARLERRTHALDHFQSLRETLRHEFGSAPDANTERLRQHLERASLEAEAKPTLLEAALIGREAERGAILNAFNREHGLVLLQGQAGIGKSRLLQELSLDAAWRGVRAIWVRPEASGTHEAYAPLRTALSGHLTPAQTARVAQQLEPRWLDAAASVIPALRAAATNTDAAPLSPADETLRIREGLYQLLTGLSAIEPCWLLIDDAQWLDEESFLLLGRLARQMPAGLHVVIAYRAQELLERSTAQPSLQALSLKATRIQLEALPGDAALRLARSSLGLEGAAMGTGELNELMSRVARETAGHPLYILESVRELLETGAIRYQNGALHAASNATVSLGLGLQGILAERLERLNSPARQILSAAALIAEPVALEALLCGAALELEAGALEVEGLHRAGWLTLRDERYSLAHDLLRQAIDAELKSAERRAVHSRIADALQRYSPDRHARLAVHLDLSQRFAQASQSYAAGARETVERSDFRTALTYLNRTLEPPLLETLGSDTLFELLELLWKVGSALSDRAAQERSLELLESTQSDPARLLHALHRRAELRCHRGEFDAALALATNAKDRATELKLPTVIAQATSSLRWICNRNGRYEQAVFYGTQAVRLFAEIGDAKAEALGLMNLGGDLMSMARTDEAWERLTAAHQQLKALGHRQSCAGTLSSMSVIETHRNHHDRARELQLEALKTAEEIGWIRSVGTCRHNLGWAAIERFQIADGLHWYGEALKTWLQIGDGNGEMNTRSSLRGVYVIYLGDWERAQEQLEAIENHALHDANPRNRWFGLDTRQLIAEQQGNPEAALEFARQKQQLAADHNDTPMELLGRWALARLGCKLNEPEALECLASLQPEVSAFGMQGLDAEFHGQLGEALLGAGRAEEALQQLEQCLTKYGVDPLAESAAGGFIQPCPAVHHLRALALWQLERWDAALQSLRRAHRELMSAFEGVAFEVRQLAFGRVPEWRALLATWEQHHLRRVTVQLPSSLTDAPAVTVQLTLEAPEDLATHNKVERRRAQLRRVLHEAAQQGAIVPRVADLAALFGCGSATIKRDLSALRALAQPVGTSRPVVPGREAVTQTQ